MTDRIQVSSGEVMTVTTTQPHSLSPSFLRSLLLLLTQKIDSSTRVVILTTSHPEALLADVAVLKSMDSQEAFAFSKLGQAVCAAMEALPFPVIAAIDGLRLAAAAN
jgi:enoyl-CoA hydratase/carnithine racemase